VQSTLKGMAAEWMEDVEDGRDDVGSGKIECEVEAMVETTVESTLESTVGRMTVESTLEATLEGMAAESMTAASMDHVEDGTDAVGSGEIECRCRKVKVGREILMVMESLAGRDVKGSVGVVCGMWREELLEFIYDRHVRGITSCWELQRTGVK